MNRKNSSKSLYTSHFFTTLLVAFLTEPMRNIAKTTAAAALIAVLSVGCAGPENKLGRGVRNFTEFTRLGEFSRSVEQTALWDGPQHAPTPPAWFVDSAAPWRAPRSALPRS